MADKTGYIGRNPGDSSVTIARKTFTPTSDTTEFTFTAGYTVGLLDVYLNGAKLIDGSDYDDNTGSTVGLTSAAQNGDVVEIIAYKAFNLANPISNTASGSLEVGTTLSVGSTATLSGVTTCEGDLYVGGDLYVLDDIVYDEVTGRNLNITGVSTFGGVVDINNNVSVSGLSELGHVNIAGVTTAGIVTATTFYGSGANLTGIAATDNINTNNIAISGIFTGGTTNTFPAEVVITAGGLEVDGGGLDIAGVSTLAGITKVTNTTASTSTSTGALVVSGGVGIAGSMFVGENVSIGGTLTYEDVTNVDSIGIVTARTGVRVTAGGLVVTAGVSTLQAVTGTTGTFSGAVNVDDVTASTSTSTGALIVDGGVGIAKSLNVAGRVNVGGKVQFTVANPQLEFNNGGPRLWSPSANTLTFHSGGGFDATSDEKLRITSAGGFSFNNGELVERVKILATALNSNQVCSLDDGMIHYRTANLGGSGGTSLDLTSAVGLNTSMDTGDTIAFTLIHATNTTGNYVDHVNVDYIPVTENWVGGSAPSSGGSSGVDIYTFNIIKKASGTGDTGFTVIGNQIKTS